MSNSMQRRPWWQVLVVGLAFALVAAGCGDDDDTADDPGTDVEDEDDGDGEETDPDEILGPLDEAEGEPIQIGFIGSGQTTAIDNTAEIVAAEAAAEYVNERQGGIGGRPIELVVCETRETPAGVQDCVTQMANAGVPAVLTGVSGDAAAIGDGITEAGITYVIMNSLESSNFMTEGSFVIANGIVLGIAGAAQIASNNGVERAGVVVIDVPAASGPVEAGGQLFYGNAGVELEVITIPPGTPDMTPQIQTAIGQGLEQLSVIGDPTFCQSALGAMETLGYDGDIVIIPQCITDELADAADLEGVQLLTSATTDPDDEEYQLYEAVLTTYGSDDAELGGTAAGGYQVVLSFARAMEGLDVAGEITSEAINTAFASMEPQPVPLLPGVEFQCDGTAVAVIAPGICSSGALLATLEADGSPGEFEPLDASEILVLPAG